MAGRATARPIIPRMIVRAEKAEQRIVEPGFLNPEENRIGPVEGPETALRQSPQWSAIRFLRRGNPKLQLFFATFFEDAEDVARVAQVEARDRIKIRKNAVKLCVVRCNRGVVDQAERHAVRAV